MTETLPEPYSGVPLATDRVVVNDPGASLVEYPVQLTAGGEELAAAEIRVAALGTGYPARRAQGCAGFLMELGNGDVFVFDAGAGMNLAFNTLRVPYHKATKFFITHYPMDHVADLPVYYDFGQSNGRLEPMHIHGPAGETPELGMEALVDSIYRFARRHDRTKLGNLDPRGFDLEPHQFVPDEAQVASMGRWGTASTMRACRWCMRRIVNHRR
jgi:ribonuclease Z